MPKYRKSANPFYLLLVLAGISFAITATAYVVLAFRDAHPADNAPATTISANVSNLEHPLMMWMRRHGTVTLLTELALLAICTFAAIGTDRYWQRPANLSRNSKP